MSDPLFTLAIPTYNNEKTIEKAISSCLDQKTDASYEILIVNNASSDNTGNIIEQYKENKKIRIVTNDETVTLFENHNVCLENAFGKYLIYCHSDDALEDHAITTFAKKLEQRSYPKKYVLWGHSMFRDYSKQYVKKAGFSINEMLTGEYAPLAFMYGGLTPSGTCFSRESFLEMGGYLKTTHKVAPSDMTSMIYLAMYGFRFEMTDEMVFKREDASNAIALGLDSYLEEIDDAYKHFIDQVDTESISELITLSSKQKNKPFYFYYAIAQASEFKPKIKRIIVRNLIKYPWRLNNPLFQKILKRVF